MSRRHQLCLAALLTATASLLGPAAALAAEPSRVYSPVPDLIVDESCGFEVDVTFPVADEYAITFSAGGNADTLIVTGRLVVRFTNPDTGASVTANISGPGRFDLVTGAGFQNGVTGGPLPVGSGLSLFAGRIDTGTGASVGHLLLDVCAALAP